VAAALGSAASSRWARYEPLRAVPAAVPPPPPGGLALCRPSLRRSSFPAPLAPGLACCPRRAPWPRPLAVPRGVPTRALPRSGRHGAPTTDSRVTPNPPPTWCPGPRRCPAPARRCSSAPPTQRTHAAAATAGTLYSSTCRQTPRANRPATTVRNKPLNNILTPTPSTVLQVPT